MWAAWLADTMSGALGPRIPLIGGSVDVDLNGTESWKITFPDTWLDTIDATWWAPWRAAALIGHTTDLAAAAWAAWCFGPITNLPKPAAASHQGGALVTIEGRGLRHILTRRVLSGNQDFQPGVSTAGDQITFKAATLGLIQAALVKAATSRKAGTLPVAYPISSPPGAPVRHTRTYDGFNLPNNDIDKLITDISNVENGPDFTLRPRLLTAEHKIVCDVLHGSDDDPHLPQEGQILWDATAPRGPILDLEVVTDAANMTTRAWATGAGEGASTLIEAVEDANLLSSGMPLLESVTSSPSTSRVETLQEHAKGVIAAGRRADIQVNLVAQNDHRTTQVGAWHVGDRVRLIAPPHRNLPGQDLTLVIIAASSKLDDAVTQIRLQPAN